MKPLPIHPYCDLLPDMSGEEWSEFCKSMQKGYDANHPILEYDGQVIDGKNRQKAALLCGVTPLYKIWKPVSKDKAEIEREILDLVKRENFDRRQLTVGQRASAAAKFATLQNGSNQHAKIKNHDKSAEKEGSSIDPPSKTTEEAAKEFKVSTASVKRAKEIQEKATPEVVAKVERGEMSLNAATNTIPPEKLKKTPVAENSIDLPPEAKAVKRMIESLSNGLAANRRKFDELFPAIDVLKNVSGKFKHQRHDKFVRAMRKLCDHIDAARNEMGGIEVLWKDTEKLKAI